MNLDLSVFTLLLDSAQATAANARIKIPAQRFRQMFVDAGERHAVAGGLSPAALANFLHATAWKESGGNPSAIGAPNKNGTRDYGLMQINERNFDRFGLNAASALDPARSIDAAAQLIRDIQIDGLFYIPDIASAYNAGETHHAARHNPDGSYVNPAYVSDVLGKYTWVAIGTALPKGLTA